MKELKAGIFFFIFFFIASFENGVFRALSSAGLISGMHDHEPGG